MSLNRAPFCESSLVNRDLRLDQDRGSELLCMQDMLLSGQKAKQPGRPDINPESM